MVNFNQLAGKKIRVADGKSAPYFENTKPPFLNAVLGYIDGRGLSYLDVISAEVQYRVIGEPELWLKVRDLNYPKGVVYFLYEDGAFVCDNATPFVVDRSDIDAAAKKDKAASGFSWLPDLKIPPIAWAVLAVAGLYFLSKIFKK